MGRLEWMIINKYTHIILLPHNMILHLIRQWVTSVIETLVFTETYGPSANGCLYILTWHTEACTCLCQGWKFLWFNWTAVSYITNVNENHACYYWIPSGDWELASIGHGADNGLVPNRRQAIIWTNAVTGPQWVKQVSKLIHHWLVWWTIMNKLQWQLEWQ